MGLGILVDGVVVQTTFAAEHGGDAGEDAVEQRGDIFIGGGIDLDEARAGVAIMVGGNEDTVGDDDVEMERQLEGRVESLHHGDRGIGIGAGGQDAGLARALTLPGEEDTEHQLEGGRGELGIRGEVVADSTGSLTRPE